MTICPMAKPAVFFTMFGLFAAAFFTALFASEPLRTWRTKSGAEIEAVWDTSSDTGGDKIRLLKDGKKFRVDIDKLAEEDFNYVRDRRAALAAGDSGDFVPEEGEETPSGGSSRGTPEASSSAGSSEIRPERPVTAKANKKFAVLVGVNEYEKLNGLRFASADVNLIRDQLLELGFEPENIFTLTSDSGAANAPLKRIIEERIGHVLDEAGSNDMIFIAFAGHGVQIDKTVFFCPQDTQEEIVNSAFSITDLIKRLEHSPARFKWMVIDACRENPFKSRTANPNARNIQKLDDPPRGLVILQSCANTELSYEDEDLGHGLFSYNLVEGLKGAAADGEGKLTLMDVCKYTTDQTVKMSVQKFGKYQRPYMTGEVSDFIIADGLLKDGLSREVWNEAEGYYQEACQFRRQRRYREAQGEIRRALNLTEGASAGSAARQKYLDEEKDIEERLETEGQLAALKRQLNGGGPAAGAAPAVQSAEPSEEPDQPAPPIAPAAQGGILGVGTKAGEKKTITVNDVDFTFRWCPEGKFMMGSPESEEGRGYDETQHRVKLTRGFWLLESEVTQEMWGSVMGIEADRGLDEAYGKGPDYPMYYVSWEESVEFCRRLGELMGERVTLPTETQWEYACRAGKEGSFAGTERLGEMGWYHDNSGGKTHPVKGMRPNAWGLYDMHGNVREWCSDWNGSYPSGPVTDPEGAESGTSRVRRGGGRDNDAEDCRSASRDNASPGSQFNDLGFRPAVVPAGQAAGSQGGPSVEAAPAVQSAEPSEEPDQSAPLIESAPQERGLGVGTEAGEKKTITVNDVDFTFCWCPAGSFTMGSPESEKGRLFIELQHRVTLTHGFWLLESEVTQSMWQSVMGNGADDRLEEKLGKGAGFPIYRVDWNEVQTFCRKLSESTGESVTLPTEAQWEYACRAGTDGPYAGTGKLDEVGWYLDNSDESVNKSL